MIFKDILTKRTYIKNGVEKTTWLNVGTLKTTPEGKEFIELNIFPNTSFYVFKREVKTVDIEKREINDKTVEKLFDSPLTEDDHIKLEDIPF